MYKFKTIGKIRTICPIHLHASGLFIIHAELVQYCRKQSCMYSLVSLTEYSPVTVQTGYGNTRQAGNGLFRLDKLKPDNEMSSEARKFVHQTYYYNVVSYIHIPLVP